MAEIKVKVRVQKWRIWLAHVLVRAAILCEWTLPGSIDEDALTDQITAFVARGVRVREV